MKRTIIINLCGQAFQIEEEAFDSLENYLDSIKSALNNNSSVQEIIDDIEGRIAELLSRTHLNVDNIITISEIEEIITIIGQPSDFSDDSTTEHQNENTNRKQSESKSQPSADNKRLYRDSERRVIGGVCAGLAAYLNTDPIIFRLLFILLTFLGFPVLVYIVLWIVIPKARSYSQKAHLHNPQSTKMSDTRRSSESGGSDPLIGMIHFFSRIIGFALATTSFLILTLITMSLLFSEQIRNFTAINTPGIIEFIDNLLIPDDLLLAKIALLILTTIPLLAIFYIGIKLLFRIKGKNAIVFIPLILIWLGGVSLAIYTGFRTMENFSSQNFIEHENNLDTPTGHTFYIEPIKNTISKGQKDINIAINRLKINSNENGLTTQGKIKFSIKKGSQYKLYIRKESRGSNENDALNQAEACIVEWYQKDSILYIDPYFTLEKYALIRDQKVNITIEVPKDSKIEVDRKIKK